MVHELHVAPGEQAGAATSATPPTAGDLVLALDQGTTNTKALLVEAAPGRVVASAARRVGITFSAPGRVAPDP